VSPQAALQRARVAYADLIAQGARVEVVTPPGNGGQPVVVLVPPGFDPNKPAKVQTHYHGDRSSAAEAGGIATRAIHDLSRRDPQTVWVLPEARGGVNSSPTDWSNVMDQGATTRDALAAVGVTNVEERTVSGHSAGGRALARAIERGTVQADRLLLLDCLYDPARQTIKKGITDHGAGIREIVVVRGTNEAARARDLVRTFAPRTRAITVPATGGQNPHDGAVRWVLDGRTNLAPDQSRFRDRFD
jgi:hypothetical protein